MLDDVVCQLINGKEVYIFESHHYALLPWSLLKRKFENEDIDLLTFDHHKDTHAPFFKYVYDNWKLNQDGKLTQKLVDAIDYHFSETVESAIAKLKHDEHITTALQSGILAHALIIAYDADELPQSLEENKRVKNVFTPEAIEQLLLGTYRLTPKEKRTYPTSDIYSPEFDKNEDESNYLSDEYLTLQLGDLARISKLITADGIPKNKYILDIDLDYFHVPEAAEPKEHEIIGRLIRNAEIVTIAKESVCVNSCSESKCNSDDLLTKILRLIEITITN